MKKITSLFLVFAVILAFIPTGAFTAQAENDVEIFDRMSGVYKAIRAARGYSYNGWCGQMVYDQLYYMKIGVSSNGQGYNGNQWYTNLKENGVTQYGYTQVGFPGNNCIYDLIAAKGDDLEYVVVSFTHEYGLSDQNPGAGHAVLIHRIKGGYVYFFENFDSAWYGYNEGEPQKRTLDAFMRSFNSSYGAAIGAVYFEGEAPFEYGDSNEDGKVTSLDVLRINKYIANYDGNGANTIRIGKGSDVNADGKVDAFDAVRLKRYFAEYDYAQKTSSVRLGPEE